MRWRSPNARLLALVEHVTSPGFLPEYGGRDRAAASIEAASGEVKLKTDP
jgi:hypothetical protein